MDEYCVVAISDQKTDYTKIIALKLKQRESYNSNYKSGSRGFESSLARHYFILFFSYLSIFPEFEKATHCPSSPKPKVNLAQVASGHFTREISDDSGPTDLRYFSLYDLNHIFHLPDPLTFRDRFGGG